jgi:hypothetical protein
MGYRDDMGSFITIHPMYLQRAVCARASGFIDRDDVLNHLASK